MFDSAHQSGRDKRPPGNQIQPAATAAAFFGLTLAALLLHEPIAWTMIASTLVVVACVAGAKRFS